MTSLNVKTYDDSIDSIREQLRAHLANSIPIEANAAVIVQVLEKFIDAKMREHDGNTK